MGIFYVDTYFLLSINIVKFVTQSSSVSNFRQNPNLINIIWRHRSVIASQIAGSSTARSTDIKKVNIKALRYWPFNEGTRCWLLVPPMKGQCYQKRCRAMKSHVEWKISQRQHGSLWTGLTHKGFHGIQMNMRGIWVFLLLGFVRTRVLMSRSRLNNGATHEGWHFDIHRDFDTRGR